MRWMYRVQQRLSITRGECNVMLALVFLMTLGLTTQYVQSQPRPLPPDVYAAQDQLFEEASARTLSPSAIADATPALPIPEPPRQEPAGAEEDTTHAANARAQPQEKTAGEQATPPQAASTARVPRMNLNIATASQLERLPRIGPKMAQRILDYRAAEGPFRRVEELINVKGIGEKTLDRLAPMLFVEEQYVEGQ